MKRVFVIGMGAQGSTIAKHLNVHPGVKEIVCADYDRDLVVRLAKMLPKAIPLQVSSTGDLMVLSGTVPTLMSGPFQFLRLTRRIRRPSFRPDRAVS